MEKINYPSKEEILNYFGDKPIRFIGYILGFNNKKYLYVAVVDNNTVERTVYIDIETGYEIPIQNFNPRGNEMKIIMVEFVGKPDLLEA